MFVMPLTGQQVCHMLLFQVMVYALLCSIRLRTDNGSLKEVQCFFLEAL